LGAETGALSRRLRRAGAITGAIANVTCGELLD
jgi:hypothetical protein